MNESTKVALVTGGGSGLGFAIAEKFIANGIVTIIAGRDAEKLKMAKASLGDLCCTRVCDLNNLGAIPGLIESVVQEFGGIDILVNNAGINQKKEFTEVTDEEFQRILTTIVCAVFAISPGGRQAYVVAWRWLHTHHQFHGFTVWAPACDCLYRQ